MLPMFYQKVAALNAQHHADAYIEPISDYNFAAKANAIALGVSEFSRAQAEYPIVFVADDKGYMPMVVTGIKQDDNSFVNDGQWRANYIPAYVRRYPYVVAEGLDGVSTVCIDEAYKGFNRDGNGQALFDSGEQSQYLKGVAEFIQQYEVEMAKSRKFTDILKDMELLEESQATLERKQGDNAALAGFFVVNRKKLDAISATELKYLQKEGALELIYQHLASLLRFQELFEKNTTLEQA